MKTIHSSYPAALYNLRWGDVKRFLWEVFFPDCAAICGISDGSSPEQSRAALGVGGRVDCAVGPPGVWIPDIHPKNQIPACGRILPAFYCENIDAVPYRPPKTWSTRGIKIRKNVRTTMPPVDTSGRGCKKQKDKRRKDINYHSGEPRP